MKYLFVSAHGIGCCLEYMPIGWLLSPSPISSFVNSINELSNISWSWTKPCRYFWSPPAKIGFEYGTQSLPEKFNHWCQIIYWLWSVCLNFTLVILCRLKVHLLFPSLCYTWHVLHPWLFLLHAGTQWLKCLVYWMRCTVDTVHVVFK